MEGFKGMNSPSNWLAGEDEELQGEEEVLLAGADVLPIEIYEGSFVGNSNRFRVVEGQGRMSALGQPNNKEHVCSSP